jgi:hypothetical protein
MIMRQAAQVSDTCRVDKVVSHTYTGIADEGAKHG